MPDSQTLAHSPPEGDERRARPNDKRKFSDRAWWPWLKRGVTTVFFLLLGYLLVTQARTIEWSQVLSSLQAYPVTAAWGAIAL